MQHQEIIKDNLLANQAEQITKLKARLHQLAKQKKAPTPISEAITTEEKSTQTTAPNPQIIADQLLEKRLQNLKEFATYREQLKAKEAQISQLTKQLKLTQQRLNLANWLKANYYWLIIIIGLLLFALLK